jgi:hypothetical protein
MPLDLDPLFARAAAVLENSRHIRTEIQQVVDNARLERLRRELTTRLLQIERMVRPSTRH